MGSAHPVIAILDDEEHFRRALSRLLQAHGYEVASFAAGEELIAEAARRTFGCVLLDLNMPGMSGFDVLSELLGELAPAGHCPDGERRSLDHEARIGPERVRLPVEAYRCPGLARLHRARLRTVAALVRCNCGVRSQ